MNWVENLLGAPAESTLPPEFPPDLFFCRLEEQPDHLVPQYFLESKYGENTEIVVHPGLVLTRESELPEALGKDSSLVQGLALKGTIAWVPHAMTGSLQPFWLSVQLADAIERMRNGSHPLDSPCPSVAALTLAGVLIPLSEAKERSTADGAAQFRERGYVPVSGLIHPFHVAALRRYFRHKIRSGGMNLGDGQSSRRYVAHNDPVARFFHHQLAPAVALFAGEAIKPSYVYAASYQGGAQLEKHTDREQCEFSVTFCLDYSPEPLLATGWPLVLHTDQGTVTVYQALGDALLYRGRALPHSRRTLKQGHTSTSIFFHYVRRNFEGSLQ